MRRALLILLAFAAGVAVGGWWFYIQGESRLVTGAEPLT